MLYRYLLNGASLPPKTVCLTYDDGPGRSPVFSRTGPRTLRIARYLRRHGIRAAFFCTGSHARMHPDIIAGLRRLGQLTGNHTDVHPRLTSLPAPGDAGAEILRADAVLRDPASVEVHFFRPSYGVWSPALAEACNRSLPLALGVFGPIGWDVSTEDWWYWREGKSPRECADAALEAIDAKGKGILLLHDSSADLPELAARNRTLELTRLLVPRLRRRGYRFACLDEIPLYRDLLGIPVRYAIKAADGSCWSVLPEGGIRTDARERSADAVFTVRPRPGGAVLLQTSDGRVVVPESGAVRAVQARVAAGADVVPVSAPDERVAFRTAGNGWLGPVAREGRLGVIAEPVYWETENLTDLPDLWGDWKPEGE